MFSTDSWVTLFPSWKAMPLECCLTQQILKLKGARNMGGFLLTHPKRVYHLETPHPLCELPPPGTGARSTSARWWRPLRGPPASGARSEREPGVGCCCFFSLRFFSPSFLRALFYGPQTRRGKYWAKRNQVPTLSTRGREGPVKSKRESPEGQNR